MSDCKKIDCCPPDIYGYQPSFEATATYTALCPVGEVGDPVTVTKTATSLISHQDAYDTALSQAREEANDSLVCISGNFDVSLITDFAQSSGSGQLISTVNDFSLEDVASYNGGFPDGESAYVPVGTTLVVNFATTSRIFSITCISGAGIVTFIAPFEFSMTVNGTPNEGGIAEMLVGISSSVYGTLYFEQDSQQANGSKSLPNPGPTYPISAGETILIEVIIACNAESLDSTAEYTTLASFGLSVGPL